MNRLVWTDVEPTEAGWYWVRIKSHIEEAPGIDRQWIGEIIPGTPGVSDCYEYAGPIPEPSEKAQ
jgi:hypothetical protein